MMKLIEMSLYYILEIAAEKTAMSERHHVGMIEAWGRRDTRRQGNCFTNTKRITNGTILSNSKQFALRVATSRRNYWNKSLNVWDANSLHVKLKY